MTPRLQDIGEARPWRFDDFEVGREIGVIELLIDRVFFDEWTQLFGLSETKGCVPMAAVPLLLMRAVTEVVTPRPPGNVHVNQRCELHRLPQVDDPIRAQVSCIDKQLRSLRRVVTFGAQLTDRRSGSLLLSGRTVIFWAA